MVGGQVSDESKQSEAQCKNSVIYEIVFLVEQFHSGHIFCQINDLRLDT